MKVYCPEGEATFDDDETTEKVRWTTIVGQSGALFKV
jgi:hypothetical protein